MNKLLNYIRRMLKVHSPSKVWHDVEKIRAQAFLQGYKQGRKDERMEIIFATVTPNMIREACGLEPIEEGETKWQQHLTK